MGVEVGEPGEVLMIGAEDDADEFWRRMTAVTDQLRADGGFSDADQRNMRERLKIHPRVGKDSRLTTVVDREIQPTGGAVAIEGMAKLMGNLKLIVIDPVSRFRGGEENSNEHATMFVEQAEKIREATGATVLMLHHVSKGGLTAGAEGIGAEFARGASALLDGVRWAAGMATLRKDEASKFGVDRDDAGKHVRFETVKNNYAAPWPGIWMKRLEGGVMAKTVLREKDASEAKEERRDELLGKIKDLILEKEDEGKRLTSTQIRDKYSGKEGPLDAGKERVRQALLLAVEEGVLTKDEDGTLSASEEL
jgi:RecA-family ATPase